MKDIEILKFRVSIDQTSYVEGQCVQVTLKVLNYI